MNEIIIAERKIGKKHPPFIIAELSGNHNNSLERALDIVNAAAEAGAHALKIQTYTADTMTINLKEGDFYINDKKSLWYGKSLYELYNEAHTPWEWHKPIMQRCNELGLIFFSTPYDKTAVEFLEGLDVPTYKIASFENTDLDLITAVASTGKPIIISTGMATLSEIDQMVRTLREAGTDKFILLKCASSYPADPKDVNIVTIPHMRETFECQVGLSDHTLGIGCAIASVALGATVIEKHFTLSRNDGGVDAAFSLEPSELKELVTETNRAWLSLGEVTYRSDECEDKYLQFRRSIYIVEDIKCGELLNEDNTRTIRPGMGLAPKYYQKILGKKINKDAKKGTPLTWDLLCSK